MKDTTEFLDWGNLILPHHKLVQSVPPHEDIFIRIYASLAKNSFSWDNDTFRISKLWNGSVTLLEITCH